MLLPVPREAVLDTRCLRRAHPPGCGSSAVSEHEYSLVWQIYSSREFEEGFFEKLSSEQRRKLFYEAANKAGADIDGLGAYMKDRHPQAYSQIFE